MSRSLLRACSIALPVVGALSTLIAPMANAQTSDGPQNADAAPAHTSYLKQVAAQAAPGVKTMGQGEHAWRFVVRHPERPNEPHRQAAYQVRLPDGLKTANGDTAVMGTTDAQGRTDIIRVQANSDPSDWIVLPALGQGPAGSVVFYHDARGGGIPDMPYLLEVDTGPIYCGLSLPTGHSAYLQVPKGHNLLQHQVGSLSECQALQKALNPIVQAPTTQARVAGIRRLMANPAWADQQEMLSDKLQAIILREGSQPDIEQHVQTHVYKAWGISKAEQAEQLNSIAYTLLTFQPPRFLPLAKQLIDQSVALNATPYNLDTQGWALHQLGRHAEALEMYTRALAAFHTLCEVDTQAMYLETLAHQAATLWVVGRHDEAIAQWASMARSNKADGIDDSWGLWLADWSQAKPAIQARIQVLDAQGAPIALSCSDLRDQQ